MRPAIVLLEFDSVAAGIESGDAMVKRAPLAALRVGTVQPGKFLVLAGGEVADVREALTAGREVAGGALVDEIFLADVHPDVVAALTGGRRAAPGESLGVIETRTVAPILGAADAAVKGATVTLLEIRMADGLGGKAYALFSGEVSDVEAAVEIGVGRLRDAAQLVGRVVIPRVHAELAENLSAHPEFGYRVRAPSGGGG